MKARMFFACVRKDLRLLFSRRAAVIFLLLPLALFALLGTRFSATAGANRAIKPFAVAIRDEDGSVLSRSLASQLAEIEIFSRVDLVAGGTPVQQLFDEGCAAVLTLPKDFFLSIYDMSNASAPVALNPARPAEAAVFRAVVESVCNIISAEQQAFRAEYALRAELGESISMADFYYESANAELRLALGRSGVFTEASLLEDTITGTLQAAWCTVTALLCLLVPLGALKGLPEELSMGVVAKLRCERGGAAMLICAKYPAALILFLVPETALTLLAGQRPGGIAIAGMWLCFSVAFVLFALLAACSRSGSRVQLAGNGIVLGMLLFGGALYPARLLPAPARALGALCLPTHLLRCLQGEAAGLLGISVWSMGVGMLLLLIAAVLRLRRAAVRRKGGEAC